MNTYTPNEMVRIELLRYNNPQELHPIEANWRNLCRKLLEDIELLEKLVIIHGHYNVDGANCIECGLGKLPRVFPGKFQTDVKVTEDQD